MTQPGAALSEDEVPAANDSGQMEKPDLGAAT
jgi:hypothetical protein